MPAPEQIDWYETPLFYDIIFDEDTDAEASFLEAMHRRHGRCVRNDPSVLELACGSGRLVREFAARGWSAAGFDANPAMLRFATERLAADGFRAHLWNDRMEHFAVPRNRRFDLAHCLVSTFKYLRTEEEALSCLRRVADVLRPGGLFILGVHLTAPGSSRPTHERWVATRDGIEVVCNTRTWPPDARRRSEAMRSRMRITLPDGMVRTQETKWEVRTYTAAQLRALVAKVKNLVLVACHDFRHDPEEHRNLDDSYADAVLVLRRE
jgi:SAM-dependent methyltransferase